jgi:hypothetical protein
MDTQWELNVKVPGEGLYYRLVQSIKDDKNDTRQDPLHQMLPMYVQQHMLKVYGIYQLPLDQITNGLVLETGKPRGK